MMGTALEVAEREPLDFFFRAKDARLHGLVWPGEAARPPAVGLPGFSAGARSLAPIGEALWAGAGLVGYDPRGRGLSDKPEPAGGYGLDRHVEDVLTLMEARGLERAPVIGHSFGALLGLLLAARHPDRVERLVLIDGGAPIPDYINQMVARLLERLDLVYPSFDDFMQPLRAAPFLQPWNAWLERYFHGEAEPLAGGVVRPRARRRQLEADQQAILDADLDIGALWPQVRCPTLVLRARHGFTGGQDWVIRPDDYAAMLKAIPDARGLEIDANHYMIVLGARPEVAEAIRAFLGGTD